MGSIPVAVCAAAAVAFIASFYWIAAHRLTYPFELEWMEGGMAEHVARLRDHRPLYVAPSAEFVPFIYNPLFYVVAAPLVAVVPDYVALRLVSIAATTVSFALLFAMVLRQTRNAFASLLSVGLFAATYSLSGGWFDIGRVDSLLVALCLAAVFVGSLESTRRVLISCAVLSALAFATKQNALALVPALWLGIWRGSSLVRSLYYLLPSLLLIAGLVLYLNLSSHGWYWFYAFDVPANHPIIQAIRADFWKYELFPQLPVPLVLGFQYLLQDRTEGRDGLRSYLAFASLGLVAMAFASRLHSGSFLNDNMPAHAALCLLAGFGADACQHGARRFYGGRLLAPILGLCQLGYLVYPPAVWLPSLDDRLEGERVLDAIRRYPGDVYVPHHPSLARRVGKATFAHEMAVTDVLRTANDRMDAKGRLRRDFDATLAGPRVSAVITDHRSEVNDAVDHYFQSAVPTFVTNASALIPKTGFAARPLLLYERRH